jgi:hypothetical protein
MSSSQPVNGIGVPCGAPMWPWMESSRQWSSGSSRRVSGAGGIGANVTVIGGRPRRGPTLYQNLYFDRASPGVESP